MEFNDLKHFYSVATCGGFSKAAREHRLQQPTLTRGVKRLEESLGVQLFKRSTRRVELTLAGSRLLRQCRSIFDALDSTPALVRGEPEDLSGYFQIAVSDSLLGRVLPEVLSRYSTLYPNVICSAATGTEPNLFEKLERGDLECGFMFSQPERRQSIFAEPLAEVPFYIVVATKVRKSQEVLNRLVAAREFEDRRPLQDTWKDYFRKISPNIKIRFSSNNYQLHKELVLRGLAISVFPAFAIKSELQRGQLTILNGHFPLSLPLNLIRRRKSVVSSKALKFIEILSPVIQKQI